MNNIEKTKKTIFRAGKNFLLNIFKESEDCKFLCGEDALKIFNTLAIPLEIIILLADSHGLIVNEEEFNILLNNQKENEKKSKLCFS